MSQDDISANAQDLINQVKEEIKEKEEKNISKTPSKNIIKVNTNDLEDPLGEKLIKQNIVINKNIKRSDSISSSDSDSSNKDNSDDEKNDDSKKGGKKGGEEKNEKKEIKIKVLYAKEYTPMQKEVLGFLRKQTYDENNKITSLDEKGNPTYKNEILSDDKIDKNSKKKEKKK